jgi:hypothetical protein
MIRTFMRLLRRGVELPPARPGSGPSDARLWFSFADEERVRISAAELKRKGYAVKVTAPDPPQTWKWGVLAGGVPATDDLQAVDKIFRKWAKSQGGDYNGPEVTVAAEATGERCGPTSPTRGVAVATPRSSSGAETIQLADLRPSGNLLPSGLDFFRFRD